jgi:ferredoxin
MKVMVDLTKCDGQGRCYNFATDVFTCGEDGKSVVKVAQIGEEDPDLVLQAQSAEMMCPMGAITTED